MTLGRGHWGGGHWGGGHWGGHGWGGGPIVYGGGYWPPAEPVYLIEQERSAPLQVRYIGFRPGEPIPRRCRELIPGVFQCPDGTTLYDVTLFELRANGLSRKGLAGLGVLPVQAPTLRPAPAPTGYTSPAPAPTPAPSATTPPPPYAPPAGMVIAPPGTCMTVSQWLTLNPDPTIVLHQGEGDFRACVVSQAQQPSGQWLVTARYTGTMYGPAGVGVGPGVPVDTTSGRQQSAPWLIPVGWTPPVTGMGTPSKVAIGVAALWLLSKVL